MNCYVCLSLLYLWSSYVDSAISHCRVCYSSPEQSKGFTECVAEEKEDVEEEAFASCVFFVK